MVKCILHEHKLKAYVGMKLLLCAFLTFAFH